MVIYGKQITVYQCEGTKPSAIDRTIGRSLSTPVRGYHGTCNFTSASAIGRTKVLRIRRRTGTLTVFFKSPKGGWGMPYIEVLPISLSYSTLCVVRMYCSVLGGRGRFLWLFCCGGIPMLTLRWTRSHGRVVRSYLSGVMYRLRTDGGRRMKNKIKVPFLHQIDSFIWVSFLPSPRPAGFRNSIYFFPARRVRVLTWPFMEGYL